MSTPFAKQGQFERKWVHIDADGQVLGRLATRIATILKGKNKAQYTPHIDVGDFVVVTNASKIRLTGKKMEDKMYNWYTGHPGGLKTANAAKMIARKPEKVIFLAVKRMLPNTPLHRHMLGKLKIYAGAEHPHAAQKPESTK
ncbi:MAG: 50S ribosomal protein L13 [Bdellovibrionota bacterium]